MKTTLTMTSSPDLARLIAEDVSLATFRACSEIAQGVYDRAVEAWPTDTGESKAGLRYTETLGADQWTLRVWHAGDSPGRGAYTPFIKIAKMAGPLQYSRSRKTGKLAARGGGQRYAVTHLLGVPMRRAEAAMVEAAADAAEKAV